MKNAVAYYRMSSDQQGETSIEQQRDEVVKLADKEGYTITREYIDYGKSGAKYLSKRVNFLQMIMDSNNKEWEAILLWDMARFGRGNPHKMASFKDTLNDNGVYLHTVKQGVIAWKSGTDYIVDAIYSSTASQYSVDLSKDCIRGKLKLLNNGYWPSGLIPYGYYKEYIGPTGERFQVARRERFSKGKAGWTRLLHKQEDEAAVVAFIFDQFVHYDASMRWIAQQITAPKPDGSTNPWTKDTVRSILRNKAYAGFGWIGGYIHGSYKPEVINHCGYHEKAGCLPAIVSEDVWRKAQERVQRYREEGIKPKTVQSSPISGILRCGHCGQKLDKQFGINSKGDAYVYFICPTSKRRKQQGRVVCKQWRVREQEILPILVRELVKSLDDAVLEASRVDLPSADSDADDSPVKGLQRKLDALVKKIERGQVNLLLADPNQVGRLNKILAEWIKEQEDLERQLHNATHTKGTISLFARWWEQQRGNLIWMGEAQWQSCQTNITEVNPPADEVSKLQVGENWVEDAEGKHHVIKTKAGRVLVAQEMQRMVVPPALEKGRFRQLLKDLGFEAKVYWEKQGPKYYRPVRVEIFTKAGLVTSEPWDGSGNEGSIKGRRAPRCGRA